MASFSTAGDVVLESLGTLSILVNASLSLHQHLFKKGSRNSPGTNDKEVPGVQ